MCVSGIKQRSVILEEPRQRGVGARVKTYGSRTGKARPPDLLIAVSVVRVSAKAIQTGSVCQRGTQLLNAMLGAR